MRQDETINSAYTLFLAGQYKDALAIYARCRDIYATTAFDANIALCELRLRNSVRSIVTPPSTGENHGAAVDPKIPEPISLKNTGLGLPSRHERETPPEQNGQTSISSPSAPADQKNRTDLARRWPQDRSLPQEIVKEHASEIDPLYLQHALHGQSLLSPHPIHPNLAFDNIYLVSLEGDRKKRYKVQRALRQLGIRHEVFQAINGYHGKARHRYDLYKLKPLGDLKHFTQHAGIELRRKSKLIESPGAIGYIYTYVKILKDAKERGFHRILILEDDIVLARNFLQRFDSFLKSIAADWKIILLGASQYDWGDIDRGQSLAQGYYRPINNATKGSFAIGLDISIADELIKNQLHFDAPFDNFPLGELYERYPNECFAAYPYLVMPDVSQSAIRAGRDQYQHSQRMGWWINDFPYPQSRLTVGVLISSERNLSQIRAIGVAACNRFYKLNLYYLSANGIQPLHDLEQLDSEYQLTNQPPGASSIWRCSDIAFFASQELILTPETVTRSVDEFFSQGRHIKGGLTILPPPEEDIKSRRVSVILTTFRRSAAIQTSLRSIVTQGYEDLEIIVVDDNPRGSTEAELTMAAVTRIADEYPTRNIRYIGHAVNANGAAARNTGIMHSTGEYVSFLDDDDIYLPSRISSAVDVLSKTSNEVGATYCGFFGWNSKQIDPQRFPTRDIPFYLLSLQYNKHYIHTNTVTYKRSALTFLGGFNPTYRRHQDLELNIRFSSYFGFEVVMDGLVRLGVSKLNMDNRVFGVDLYRVKTKFLQEFSEMIDRYEHPRRVLIYEAHWRELIRYSADREAVLRFLREQYQEGGLQLWIGLSGSEGG